MYSQSGAATHEIYQIFNPFQPRIREIVEDEPDVKICHSCGQLDTRQSCDCDAQTRVRRYIAEQFLKMDFVWMSNDVLKCDEHTLRNYTYILFFYSPSQEFMQLLKEAHIYNYADCGSCKEACTPEYLYGDKEPLCRRCAGEILN